MKIYPWSVMTLCFVTIHIVFLAVFSDVCMYVDISLGESSKIQIALIILSTGEITPKIFSTFVNYTCLKKL